MNRVILKGRIGSDITLNYVGSKNTPLAKFKLAVPDKLEPKNKDKTYWAFMVVWGKLAEVCQQYLSQGKEAIFEGRMSRATWEKDGVKHSKDEVIVESMEFCGPATKSASAPQEPDPHLPF